MSHYSPLLLDVFDVLVNFRAISGSITFSHHWKELFLKSSLSLSHFVQNSFLLTFLIFCQNYLFFYILVNIIVLVKESLHCWFWYWKVTLLDYKVRCYFISIIQHSLQGFLYQSRCSVVNFWFNSSFLFYFTNGNHSCFF